MDSNQITPEMVYKFIDGLYKDTYPGFIRDYRVEVMESGFKYPIRTVTIHVLMDDEVYGNTGEGYLAVQDMEDKLKGVLKILTLSAPMWRLQDILVIVMEVLRDGKIKQKIYNG